MGTLLSSITIDQAVVALIEFPDPPHYEVRLYHVGAADHRTLAVACDRAEAERAYEHATPIIRYEA